MSDTAYDKVVYDSFPYSHTLPSKMATIAKIFGVDSPDFNKCSILELGCAAGGNIIPMAYRYPKAKIVGIDLSEKQTQIGEKQIKDLGLKNIKLKTMSINDINKDFGKFDYIICHGILSWVPKDVQEAIYRVCKENLTKNGLALVSYNTLPGWNTVKSIRDMMRFHIKDIVDPKERIEQAIAILKFVAQGATGHHKEAIERELKLLDGQQASYFFHDHLEATNDQFYFSDFMDKAREHGLEYLGDSSFASMYAGNYSKNVRQTLASMTDIVKQEQYMDFITNRRFRNTILCHDDVKINRNIDSSIIKELCIASKAIYPKNYKEKDINSQKELEFCLANKTDSTIKTKSIAGKAFLITMQNNSYRFLSYENAIKETLDKFSFVDKKDLEGFINNMGMQLVVSGFLDVNIEESAKIKETKKPKLEKLAQYQIANQNWFTNNKHEKINIDLPAKVILSLIDGNKNVDEIVAKAIEKVKDGTLTISNKDGEVVKGDKIIKNTMIPMVNNVITKAHYAGIVE